MSRVWCLVVLCFAVVLSVLCVSAFAQATAATAGHEVALLPEAGSTSPPAVAAGNDPKPSPAQQGSPSGEQPAGKAETKAPSRFVTAALPGDPVGAGRRGRSPRTSTTTARAISPASPVPSSAPGR
jgi:hypothetical protein